MEYIPRKAKKPNLFGQLFTVGTAIEIKNHKGTPRLIYSNQIGLASKQPLLLKQFVMKTEA